jgi:lactoylglutathione lyase
MTPAPTPETNVKQVVPFLHVSNMETSLHFYIEGLGFAVQNQWVVDGKVRWCWLTLGGAAIMLQQFRTEGSDSWKPSGKVGDGVSLCFQCRDALSIYQSAKSRGLEASEPEVGNHMWFTCISDPDGFRLSFHSATDTPEETRLSDIKN